MEQLSAPCLGCANRVLGCHSTCEEYKAFSENKKAASSKKIEADKKHYLASNTAFKLKAKLYKRYGRH